MASGIRFDFKLVGLEKTRKALKQLNYDITAVDVRNAVKYAIKPAEDMATANMPRGDKPHDVESKGSKWGVLPPYAVTQVRSRAKKYKNGLGAYVLLGVRNPAYYAASFVELGTKYQQAQPWLRTAFIGTRAEQMARFTKWFQRKLKRVIKGRK